MTSRTDSLVPEKTNVSMIELSLRAANKGELTPENWPAALDDTHASTLRVALRDIFDACVKFAAGKTQ